MHNKLRAEGFGGSYPTVVRPVRAARGLRFRAAAAVSVPIFTGPGEEELRPGPHRHPEADAAPMRRRAHSQLGLRVTAPVASASTCGLPTMKPKTRYQSLLPQPHRNGQKVAAAEAA